MGLHFNQDSRIGANGASAFSPIAKPSVGAANSGRSHAAAGNSGAADAFSASDATLFGQGASVDFAAVARAACERASQMSLHDALDELDPRTGNALMLLG